MNPKNSIVQQVDDPLALIRESDVAERWKKSLRTLQRWRAEGYGPAYLRIGGSIFYRVSDVVAFEDRARRGGECC
jgi:hypothetical protein